MEKVGKFCLKNDGWFDVKLQFVWYRDDKACHVDGTDAYPIYQTKSRTPGESGIPGGAKVGLYAFVCWGNDKTAAEIFEYDPNSKYTANYTISGTTLSSSLVLTNPVRVAEPDLVHA
jgi:hypothetical protein